MAYGSSGGNFGAGGDGSVLRGTARATGARADAGVYTRGGKQECMGRSVHGSAGGARRSVLQDVLPGLPRRGSGTGRRRHAVNASRRGLSTRLERADGKRPVRKNPHHNADQQTG